MQCYFRKKRGEQLKFFFPQIENFNILDIGGSEHFWREIGLNINPNRITLLNINYSDHERDTRFKKLLYDGKQIPFLLGDFDLVISNSVIEHIDPIYRKNFSAQIEKISKNYYIQTPNYNFFIEPHFIMPFIHWLPKKIGWHLTKISPWKLLGRPSHMTHLNYFWNTNLLKKDELKHLFMQSTIYNENVLLMTKSFIAIKKVD